MLAGERKPQADQAVLAPNGADGFESAGGNDEAEEESASSSEAECQVSFNDWGEAGMSQNCPRFGEGGTKTAPPGDLFNRPPGEMSWIRGKLADHVGDHVVLSPEGVVLMTSSWTESLYPRPPQSLKHSQFQSTVDDDESGGKEESEDASRGQPESVEDIESGGGGEGNAAESTSAEDEGESSGKLMRNRAKAKRGSVPLEMGSASAPESSFPNNNSPLRAERALLRARRAPLQAGRAPKAKQATRCLPWISRHIFPPHPTQVIGRVLSQ